MSQGLFSSLARKSSVHFCSSSLDAFRSSVGSNPVLSRLQKLGAILAWPLVRKSSLFTLRVFRHKLEIKVTVSDFLLQTDECVCTYECVCVCVCVGVCVF